MTDLVKAPDVMTRAEHLAWCKERALKELDFNGDVNNAFTSMASDLEKHEATRGHSGTKLGMMMLMAGQLRRPEEMRRFIKGFN
jgi:hypothetical protein